MRIETLHHRFVYSLTAKRLLRRPFFFIMRTYCGRPAPVQRTAGSTPAASFFAFLSSYISWSASAIRASRS